MPLFSRLKMHFKSMSLSSRLFIFINFPKPTCYYLKSIFKTTLCLKCSTGSLRYHHRFFLAQGRQHQCCIIILSQINALLDQYFASTRHLGVPADSQVKPYSIKVFFGFFFFQIFLCLCATRATDSKLNTLLLRAITSMVSADAFQDREEIVRYVFLPVNQ